LEHFNGPKKVTCEEFQGLAVISYQVRTLTLKTLLCHSNDKENLIKAGEKNLGLQWGGEGGRGGGGG